jgi:DNA-binding Lrp family transcriptional regulator
MTVGFVLIATKPACEQDVHAVLNEISEIESIHVLFGEYDLIVKIKSNSFDELGEIVVDKIKSINGVLNTKTLSGINH